MFFYFDFPGLVTYLSLSLLIYLLWYTIDQNDKIQQSKIWFLCFIQSSTSYNLFQFKNGLKRHIQWEHSFNPELPAAVPPKEKLPAAAPPTKKLPYIFCGNGVADKLISCNLCGKAFGNEAGVNILHISPCRLSAHWLKSLPIDQQFFPYAIPPGPPLTSLESTSIILYHT